VQDHNARQSAPGPWLRNIDENRVSRDELTQNLEIQGMAP